MIGVGVCIGAEEAKTMRCDEVGNTKDYAI